MRRVLLCVVIALCACKSAQDKKSEGDGVGAAEEKTLDSLVKSANVVLDELAALEAQKDVTCWTSFQQLDWFIAEKSYSEFATLSKITAVKDLIRAIWARASEKAGRGPVTASHFAAAVKLPDVALPEKAQDEFASFANDIGVKNYTDYQKTAEHWRVVLGVLSDEIYQTGGKPSLLAPDESGLAELDIVSEKRVLRPLSAKAVAEHLNPLTKRLIDGKAKALQSFNKGAKRVGADLNRVSRLPITPDGVKVLRLSAQSFIRFAAQGIDPMRADNYLSDGSFAKTEFVRKAYINELDAQNLVMQIFPHHILPNGDVLLRYEPNPGPITNLELEPFELRLLDHEMNGVRDSAVHWLSMQAVWSELPYAMDPFAAEYISEVVSMMVTAWIRRAESLAKERRVSQLDGKLVQSALGNTYVMVPPRDAAASRWDKSKQETKAKVLAQYRGPLFRDVSKQSGLPAELAGGAAKNFDLQTIMGSGLAVGDINGDDYPDLFVAGESLGRLYLNRGKRGPGRFDDVTDAWGIPKGLSDSRGSLFFDVEGDGDLDLLVLRSEKASQIFLQDGGRFTDGTASLGFGTGRGAHVATVLDYDRDGDLDLYVGYYGNDKAHRNPGKERNIPALDGRNGTANQLWRNDGGKFVEVAGKAGVADVGWTLAVGAFDYDGDGHLDLYLANDFGPNKMFRNLGNGTFEDATAKTGTGDRGSGMNVDVADVNGDGVWDFYVTNIDMFSKNIKVVFPRDESTIDITESLTRAFQYIAGNKLYVSQPGGEFRAEEAERMEPVDRGWGWDAAFFDYDLDGDDDMYVTNGWLDGSYAGNQKNQMYINHEGSFYLAPDTSAEAFAGNTRSAAAVDVDLDGDLDLVTNNFRQPPRLFQNLNGKKNVWAQFRLQAAGKNPHAIGAKVIVHAGGRKLMRQVSAGRGYISQNDTLVTVAGLGQKTVKVEVFWPDGSTSSIDNVPTGKRTVIKQPGS
jgi:hypothetical protein